jgi:hypothetical protein
LTLGPPLIHTISSPHPPPRTQPRRPTRIELPFVGNGILEVASSKGIGSDIPVDDRGCADVPLFKELGCNCWNVPYKLCTHPVEYCRICTKDYPKPAGTGTSRVPPPSVSVRGSHAGCS